MLKPAVTKTDNAESRFLHLYKIVQEREKYLSKEALVVQYSALLRYFMKFLGRVYGQCCSYFVLDIYKTWRYLL